MSALNDPDCQEVANYVFDGALGAWFVASQRISGDPFCPGVVLLYLDAALHTSPQIKPPTVGDRGAFRVPTKDLLDFLIKLKRTPNQSQPQAKFQARKWAKNYLISLKKLGFLRLVWVNDHQCLINLAYRDIVVMKWLNDQCQKNSIRPAVARLFTMLLKYQYHGSLSQLVPRAVSVPVWKHGQLAGRQKLTSRLIGHYFKTCMIECTRALLGGGADMNPLSKTPLKLKAAKTSAVYIAAGAGESLKKAKEAAKKAVAAQLNKFYHTDPISNGLAAELWDMDPRQMKRHMQDRFTVLVKPRAVMGSDQRHINSVKARSKIREACKEVGHRPPRFRPTGEGYSMEWDLPNKVLFRKGGNQWSVSFCWQLEAKRMNLSSIPLAPPKAKAKQTHHIATAFAFTTTCKGRVCVVGGEITVNKNNPSKKRGALRNKLRKLGFVKPSLYGSWARESVVPIRPTHTAPRNRKPKGHKGFWRTKLEELVVQRDHPRRAPARHCWIPHEKDTVIHHTLLHNVYIENVGKKKTPPGPPESPSKAILREYREELAKDRLNHQRSTSKGCEEREMGMKEPKKTNQERLKETKEARDYHDELRKQARTKRRGGAGSLRKEVEAELAAAEWEQERGLDEWPP